MAELVRLPRQGFTSSDITGLTAATPASGDFFVFSDTSDSGSLKKADFDDLGGGATSPAGANTQIQYNNSGSFGADSGLTYTAGTQTLATVDLDVSGDLTSNTADIAGLTQTGTCVIGTASAIPSDNLNTRLYIEGSGSLGTGRTNFSIRNTTATSAASIRVINSAGAAFLIQCSGPSYSTGESASISSIGGVNLIVACDVDTEFGGTNSIIIKTGGFGTSNEFTYFTGDKRMGVGLSSPQATCHVFSRTASIANTIMQAAASQTGNMLEVQDSSAAVQLAIAANGRDFVLDTTTGTKFGTATSQKLSFFNATPVVQQTGGAATAGGTYTATEQTMLQTAYDALRTYGLLS